MIPFRSTLGYRTLLLVLIMMEFLAPDISVIVATRNRAHCLEQMLLSLEEQALEGLVCELIVIDNGSIDDTMSMLNRWKTRFTLLALHEEIPGKSRALNHGLDAAAGKLIVFTDDDITAPPAWLRSLYEAFVKYDSAAVFCGPIIPIFPPGTPEWMRNHRGAGSMFGRFDPGFAEGPLPAGWLPYGANLAVRAAVLGGMRFRLDLGPSEENGPLLGEDVEFAGRFLKTPQNIIFVPDARVDHVLSPLQIEFPSLIERAFHLGRESVMDHRRRTLQEPLQPLSEPGEQDFMERVEWAGQINYYLGQLYQLHVLGGSPVEDDLRRALNSVRARSPIDLLGKSARLFYFSLMGPN